MKKRRAMVVLCGLAMALVVPATTEARPSERAEWLPFHGSYRVTRTQHKGSAYGVHAVDFAMGSGKSVRSAGYGTVVAAGTQSCGGRFVAIYHRDQNRTSMYFHLSEIRASRGQAVKPGQKIGEAGSSGTCATAAHLHYEERPGKVDRNGTGRQRIDPGDFRACHGKKRVTYRYSSMAGKTLRHDGTACA